MRCHPLLSTATFCGWHCSTGCVIVEGGAIGNCCGYGGRGRWWRRLWSQPLCRCRWRRQPARCNCLACTLGAPQGKFLRVNNPIPVGIKRCAKRTQFGRCDDTRQELRQVATQLTHRKCPIAIVVEAREQCAEV
jgi:hypothetical protein